MGAPRCAACHISVVGRVFKIRDELVFHEACVNLPALLEQRVTTLAEEVKAERSAKLEERKLRRDIQGEVDRAVSGLQTQTTTERLARDALTADLAAARNDVYQTSMELTRARARIAELEAKIAERADPAPAQDDDHDASSIRFGLLEPY